MGVIKIFAKFCNGLALYHQLDQTGSFYDRSYTGNSLGTLVHCIEYSVAHPRKYACQGLH